MYEIEELIALAAEKRASDVHLIAGLPPKCRIDGRIETLTEGVLTREDCEEYGRQLAGDAADPIEAIGQLDFSASFAGRRLRVNLFRQQGALSAAIRLLGRTIPNLSELGLPEAVNQFSSWNKGIILVTGETGSGKSTTLAAILNEINQNRPLHMITLEDPIEYVYEPAQAIINQREVGVDVESYDKGLYAALREDPDVILIGEMRDLATIETALMAAETGHLVFSTIHTNSAIDSIDRIVGVFPEDKQPQIRMQLSMTLRAVLAQQLVPRAGGQGRAAACELMMITPAIRNLIRDGKTPQMQSYLLSSAKEGSITMDNFLIRMAKEGVITPQTAVDASRNPQEVRRDLAAVQY
ncbi:type IV pilus twitching motility protein PilT [uncultured Clostridium sp.]|uniref:type IV pilus twitching motility protein PilT n=1 Tax=uncultured Clostridium sp. TaxID=59620 RepID=UPI0025EC883B|nr:type IV pilus twitching motility protein PilT [uncultured Clostridium sp.]